MAISVDGLTSHSSGVLAIFIVGYLLIICEGIFKLNKVATALLMAIGCWALLFFEPEASLEKHQMILTFQMFQVSQILFFLLGALTIVEIINTHNGFHIIAKKLEISSKRRLLWTTAIVAFVLSSVLDNLTTTIIMISIIAKMIKDQEERLLLGGLIVIAANTGGVWTPIGDVATTLLWINGRVTAFPLMRDLFLPSLLGLVAAVLWFNPLFKGDVDRNLNVQKSIKPEPFGNLILILGISCLIFVPIFRLLTGMPAFMGMMFGLGVMWVVTDLLHYKYKEREYLRVPAIFPRVEISVIFLYLGILLSIHALETAGLLKNMVHWLNLHTFSPLWIPFFIGLVSALVDNVSLVAAIIAMYDLQTFIPNSPFWEIVAYSAGVGGSILIIGSAAGVAFMAIERVNFLWYVKKITFPAIIAYVTGIVFYFLLSPFTRILG